MFCLLIFLLPFVTALPSLGVNIDLGSLVEPTSNGVLRYSLKYATAKRWAQPVQSTTLVPANASYPTALPLACPQSDLNSTQFSEDCLDLVLYVPPTAKSTVGGVPTIFWVHGGSFAFGSATNPGLDGSNFAVGANAIIAVVQYRLGALGLLPPSSSSALGNLAVQDLITALKFLHQFLPHFGGSPHTPHLTIAGQSSGGSLIRALLGIPTAASLFSSAWLHSDPLDFGFLTSSAVATLRKAWLKELGCATSDGCAHNMDLSTLLAHQDNLLNAAPKLGPEFFQFAPLRPDGAFIPNTLSSTFPPAKARKPLVLSTVRDEATTTIFSLFPDALPPDSFGPIVNNTLGPKRAAAIMASSFYPTNSSDARVPLQVLGTDQVWRCAAGLLAREWVPTHTYVGVFTRGVTYPGNELCIPLKAVCHQDDIMVLFGTGGQDSGTIRQLTHELQSRYGAFVRTGNPNAGGLATWREATADNVYAQILSGANNETGTFPVQACKQSFWGKQVLFDYQILGE